MNPSLPFFPRSLSLVSRMKTGAAALLFLGTLSAGSAQADVGDFFTHLFSGVSTTLISVDTPNGDIKVKIQGSVDFNAAEDDVQNVSRYAAFREHRDGRTIRINFDNEDGKMRRVYSIDGEEKPFDAEAKRWLAEVIGTFLRESAYNADVRVRRMYAQGGTAAVLAEIQKTHSSHARGRYIRALLNTTTLDDKSLQELIVSASKMNSDYERRQVLSAIVNRQTLTPAHQVVVLNAVADMNSSYEQRQVLTAMAPTLAADAEVGKAWTKAINHMESDYELRGVIESLARRESLSAGQLQIAIDATEYIGSDYEQATALISLMKHLPQAAPAQLGAYLQSVGKIHSDYERSRVLVGLINRVKLNKDGYFGILKAADDIDSDYEKGKVLRTAAKSMPADSDLVARYRRAARSLGEHERGQVEKALDHMNM